MNLGQVDHARKAIGRLLKIVELDDALAGLADGSLHLIEVAVEQVDLR